MKHLLGRLIVGAWFLGMIWIAVRTPPIHGEGGENTTFYFPSVSNNLPFLSNPAIENYIGLVTSEQDGDLDIYTVRADGSDLLQLTYNDVPDKHPIWSPQGKQIAFIRGEGSSQQAVVMKQNGADLQVLVDANVRRIAWVSESELLVELYQGQILTINTTSEEMTTLVERMYTWVGLSPTGTHFAYMQSAFASNELWTMEIGTQTATRICGACVLIAWQPNSGGILFRQADESGRERYFFANADGSNSRLLFQAPYHFYEWALGGSTLLLQKGDDPNRNGLYQLSVAGGAIETVIQDVEGALVVLGVSPATGDVAYTYDETLFLQPLDRTPAIEVGYACSFSSPAHCRYLENSALWVADGSEFIFSTRFFNDRFEGMSLSLVKIINGVPIITQRRLLATQAGFDTTILPFPSRLALVEVMEGYPSPDDFNIIDWEHELITPLPFTLEDNTSFGEWRYLPR